MKKLIVPIYSMRSHKTGKYSVLKDGNFQLHLNRAGPEDIICVPGNSSDLTELYEIFGSNKFVEINYLESAYETRKNFWNVNLNIVEILYYYYKCSAIVTDITGYPGNKPVFFNFNITMDPLNPRYYIDEFIKLDVESVNKSIYTTVLNQSQKDYLIQCGATGTIVVSQKVINPEIYKLMESKEIDIGNSVFFPFRISDPCYRFDLVYKLCESLNINLVVTDPNESLDKKDVQLMSPTKQEYYGILKSRPTIIYNENPEKVFHPGLAEFIFYDCNIICRYNLPTKQDVIIDGETWLI